MRRGKGQDLPRRVVRICISCHATQGTTDGLYRQCSGSLPGNRNQCFNPAAAEGHPELTYYRTKRLDGDETSVSKGKNRGTEACGKCGMGQPHASCEANMTGKYLNRWIKGKSEEKCSNGDRKEGKTQNDGRTTSKLTLDLVKRNLKRQPTSTILCRPRDRTGLAMPQYLHIS